MYCGWLQDSIWDLWNSDWRFFRELPYAQVTCIDSTENVRSTGTARRIVESEGCCWVVGTSLVVGDGGLLDIALRYDPFSHFDEVWLFETRPTADKPAGTSIVYPIDLSVEAPSEELVEWFSASGCVLGLGDGGGMNYMTTSQRIADALSMRQEGYND